MLLYPAMNDLLKNVPSRYLLVNVVAHRARELSHHRPDSEERPVDKPVTAAIEEVAAGEINMEKLGEDWGDAPLF